MSFGNRNQTGVSVFMTTDEKVAKAIRRHSLCRRGVIEETTPKQEPAVTVVKPPQTVQEPADIPAKQPTGDTTEVEAVEREYDNYTVARESICKEFGIKKEKVRNPTALARAAKEHGIIIKYKEK